MPRMNADANNDRLNFGAATTLASNHTGHDLMATDISIDIIPAIGQKAW